MRKRYAVQLIAVFLLLGGVMVQGQTHETWWELTVTEVRRENELQDIFLSTYSPGAGETFLVVVTSLKDVQFDSAAPLPEGDMLVQGVRLVGGEVPSEVHGFALADVVVTDATGKSYALYAFAIYSDILIAPNLNDFSAAAPYEEVVYTFVFAVPAAQINDPFTLTFDGVSLGEITVGQAGIVSSGGEVAPEATATTAPTATPLAAPTQTPGIAATPTPTATVTATPSPSPTLPPLLMNIPTKSSYEIYTLPSTSSERLVAAAVGFSPHVAGVNTDQSWVYIYFFTPEGMRDGWIRSSRMELDETALSSLPIIDPENPPPLPGLAYDEDAAPVNLRESVMEATADASAVHEVIFDMDNCTSSPPVILEGDILFFNISIQYVPRHLFIYVDGVGITDRMTSEILGIGGFMWRATSGEHHLSATRTILGEVQNSWQCDFEVAVRPSAAVPTQAVVIPPPASLMNVSTKSSYEIYTEPSTSSQRLVAANDAFSPYVVGVNADQSWVYIYFFLPEGMQGGWIRSSRMNLDEAALSSLPVIDPENLSVLPLLEYDELAVPVHLRQVVIQATADASTVREIYVVAPVQWNKTEYVCDSVDGSPIREGDIVYFSFTNFALTRQAADSVRWNVRVDGKLLEDMSYVVEENVEEKGGEWTLPYRVWTYAAWTAEAGTHLMSGQASEGAGGGVRGQECTIEVEPRPWMSQGASD